MINNLLIICLISMIIVLSEAQSIGHCKTPDNRNGFCVSIRSCDVLLQMARGRVLFAEDREFLLRSKCGTNINDVCCPSDAEYTTTEIYITSTRRYITTTSQIFVPYTHRSLIRRPTYMPRTTTTQATSEPAIRISAKKCNEYADYAYNKTYTVNVLSDFPRVTKTSNCGYQAVGLVVGGEEAKRREFPHMALIGFTYNGKTHWDCGGTLISEKFVLSAAHCSYNDITGPAKNVRLGEHDLSRTDDASHVDFDIIERIRHHNVPQRTYNDIVLFKLDRDVELNHVIRPACLPEQSTVPRDVSASGWGTTRYRANRGSKVLLKVDLMTFSPDERDQSEIGRNFSRMFDEESIVFAGHLTRRRDTCQGDSGGPLQVIHETLHCTYVVYGVTSTGKGCGNIGLPGIYTAVYSHLDWIEKTVWPNE